MAKGELTFKNYIRVGNSEFVPWLSLTEEERKILGVTMNDRALRNAGLEPTKKVRTMTEEEKIKIEIHIAEIKERENAVL